ncbi:hypothetical protein CYMTET_4578 [Cymbomonas tetramitiformis]|uniref:Uncharacterized protein n=1 Tax=Cymbomonas tetramitiformis TaxID=36881 RepID=A0AAE0LJR6_9CHLO|nr:hypothetical protein CYMTET_4578 [Cymbomonas tetramitiformis]
MTTDQDGVKYPLMGKNEERVKEGQRTREQKLSLLGLYENYDAAKKTEIPLVDCPLEGCKHTQVYYRIVYESLIDEISRPGDKRPRCAAQEQFGGRFALGMVASVAFSVENAGIATTWSDANAVRLFAGGMWRCSFDAAVTKENHDALAAQLLAPTPNEIDSDRASQSAPRVFALLTLRYADGHPLSSKKKPFRFWLDPAVISHATAEARRANSDDLRLPIIFRGQLLTNEKRRVSIKNGGACAIRCSRAGRVEGVRVSLAVDELERDVHVDDL